MDVWIGFYRGGVWEIGILPSGGIGAEHWRVRNFTTLHEIFHVYADEDGVLRTDHEITFVGLTILKLHYKMTLALNANAQTVPEVRSSLQPA